MKMDYCVRSELPVPCNHLLAETIMSRGVVQVLAEGVTGIFLSGPVISLPAVAR